LETAVVVLFEIADGLLLIFDGLSLNAVVLAELEEVG
jgi:hypothetical protein